jgi:aspartate kinase
VGAYERGSARSRCPRLKNLADFYKVPVAVLLGEPLPVQQTGERRKIVLDLAALAEIDPAAPIRRFVQSIIESRGDFNGRVLSLRNDDLKALCTLVGGDIPTGVAQLRSWGVMIDGPEIPDQPLSTRSGVGGRRGAPVPCGAVGLVVQKFGGTSVADPERIREVADHVARTRKRGDAVVVVVSAMGKETDELLHLAEQVSTTRPGREMDMLITAGERKATALLCMALHDLGVPADSFTGSQAGFLTDTNHMNAKILEVRADRIRAAVDAGTGAGGGRRAGRVHRARRHLPRPRRLRHHGGGPRRGAGWCVRALHRCVGGVHHRPARGAGRQADGADLLRRDARDVRSGLPEAGDAGGRVRPYPRRHLHVRSAFTWEPGTWITHEEPDMEDAIVSGVVGDDSEAKVTITGVPDRPGVSAALFRALADADVNVDMIVQNVSEQGHTDISFTVPADSLGDSVAIVEQVAPMIGASGVTSDPSIAKVSLVGAGMKTNPGRGGHGVRDARCQRHQHRDDLHLGHPHLVRGGRRRVRQGGRRAPHGVRPRRQLTQAVAERPWASGGSARSLNPCA